MEEAVFCSILKNKQAEETVRTVLQVYEQAFPGRIIAGYVEGSYTDQSYVSSSDIDIELIFRDHFINDKEKQAAQQLWDDGKHNCPIMADVAITDEASLRKGVNPMLKLTGLHVYGEDVCQRYPLMPIADWTRDRMHATYWLLVSLYERPKPVCLPLLYPDEQDEFYGYTKRLLRLPDGQEVPCTRNLVRTTGWAATALLAWKSGHYASRKRDCEKLYRTYINDEWATLLEEIALWCRNTWQYLIPTTSSERNHLRSICARSRQFEEHFVYQYKDYVLDQLTTASPDQVRFALWVQEQCPLDDAELKAAVDAAQRRLQ
jgi:hypothetical protein